MELVVAILSWMGETSTDAVVNLDSSVAVLLKFRASGSFLVVNWLDIWKPVEVCLCSVISFNLRVIHHLGTAGADSDDLAKVSSLFDEAVKLFADALDLVVVREVSVLGDVPAVNVDSVLGRVAVTAVSGAISVSTRSCGAGFAVCIIGDIVDAVVRVGPSIRSVVLSGGGNE